MIRKRSKFLTVCFSLLPGAGQMYLGFMRIGLSLMSLLFAVIFISAVFGLNEILYALPVLWCYAFFDAINRMSLPDEQFLALEDKTLFPMGRISASLKAVRYRPWVGVALIASGLYLLWRRLWPGIAHTFTEQVRMAGDAVYSSLPKIAASLLIILVGVLLIVYRKPKKEAEHV